MTRNPFAAAGLLLLTIALAGCSTRQAEGPLPPTATRTTIRVENNNFLDMTVYAVRGSQRVRLGTVSGVSVRVFTIPPNLVFGSSTLQFQADPVGSRATSTTHEITIRPGDQVTLTIPNH